MALTKVTSAGLSDEIDISSGLTLKDQAELRFNEANTNGTNWVAFKAPTSIETNVTWTLPSADADVAGYALVSDGTGTLNWAAAGGGNIPTNSQTTSYTLVATDLGKLINITTGGVTVPSSIFSAGDTVSIYNNSTSSQTITQGSGVTLRLAGTATTGNRTLAQYGIASVLCVAADIFVITGVGVS